MTTLATLTTVAVAFAWILGQEWRELTKSNRYTDDLTRHPKEWRQLTRNNRYVCKLKPHYEVMLEKAKPNERRMP